MHPLFVTLFIETDADDLLAGEQDRKRRARAARRGRSARAAGLPPPARIARVAPEETAHRWRGVADLQNTTVRLARLFGISAGRRSTACHTGDFGLGSTWQ